MGPSERTGVLPQLPVPSTGMRSKSEAGLSHRAAVLALEERLRENPLIEIFLGSVPNPFSPHSLCRRCTGEPHLRNVAPRTRFSEVKQARARAY